MNYWQPAIVAFRSNYLPAYKAAVIYVPISHLYICRESSTNRLLFMQNKPNFPDTQMNVNLYNTTDYENKSNWTLGQNKPNSNPIKPNFRKAQMNVSSLITKDYERNDIFAVPENKANSNPKQTQTKPILEAMFVNFYAKVYYESKPTFAANNPKLEVTTAGSFRARFITRDG